MKNKSPAISFEFYPPKTPEGSERLFHAAADLAHCQPSFFSVTFGAGGSTRAGTLGTVDRLQQLTSVHVAPHLACIGSTRAEIRSLLEHYRGMNIRRIVAIRGDLPVDMMQEGEFKFASELVEFIRKETGDYFHLEVAAYPEIHPQAQNPEMDLLNLKRKWEAGADSAITQFFYNVDAFFRFRDDCYKHGISIPVIPGIMPITQFARLARFADMCGAEIPRWLRKRLEAYEHNAEALIAYGVEVVHQLCERLLAAEVPGLHFYTLNAAEPSMKLVKKLMTTAKLANKAFALAKTEKQAV